MAIHFISDLHLDTDTSTLWSGLERFITTISPASEGLYILGDLTEVWVGDDDDSTLVDRLRTILTTAASRFPLYLMHGNRDFLIGDRFAREVSATLLPETHSIIGPGGGRLLACHGDSLCTDDAEYQQMRTLFRDPAWQAGILAQSLAERRALADQLRAASLANNANKASNIMDVNAGATAALALDHGVDVIIHGHTHRPAHHREPWGDRYVLGDWGRCGWYIEVDANRLGLKSFALH